jgi:hypothetical protein
MSYIRKKQHIANKESSTSIQTLDTSYVEITGSRAEFTSVSSSNKLVYRFIFDIQLTSSVNKWFLHIKLQKSTDGFSSDINDVSGANYNVASDERNVTDYLYRLNTAFFVINGLSGTNQFRLVCRTYSNSLKPQLHQGNHFDGGASVKIFDPSLVLFEV